jgi:hypothetical protein
MKNLNRQQTAQSHSQDTRRESSLSIAMRALKRATITSLAALLLFSSTEAAPLQGSLKLNYKVRDTEILYAVATASGDLKVVNKGPGRARVRWIDPATGAEEQKVLRDEEVLFTNGQLGAQVSAGTLVVIEKLGPAVLSRGFATLPSAPSLTAAFSSQQGSGTFLPWHRGSPPLYRTVKSALSSLFCNAPYRYCLVLPPPWNPCASTLGSLSRLGSSR